MKTNRKNWSYIFVSIISALIGAAATIIAVYLQPSVIIKPIIKPYIVLRDTTFLKSINNSITENAIEDDIRPNFELPIGTNILIFNACDSKSAHQTLQKHLKEVFPQISVTARYNWLRRWEMKHTAIYYITRSYENEAKNLEKWFPKKQHIVDYYNQFGFNPDLKYRMQGLESRDLVIFIGNDYRNLLSVF